MSFLARFRALPRSMPCRSELLWPVVALFLTFSVAQTALAQDPTALLPAALTTATDPALAPKLPTAAEVVEARAAVAGELDQARPRALALGAADAEVQEVALLERLDLLYEQQIATLGEFAQYETALGVAEKERDDGALIGDGPFPLSDLDDAREDQVSFAQRLDGAIAGVEAASQALDEARENLALREKARRGAKDVAETGSDKSAAPEIELRVRTLESRVATEVVVLRTLQLENAKMVRRIHEVGAETRARRVERLSTTAKLTLGELQKTLEELDQEEAALRRELVTAKKAVATAEREWAEAQRRAEKGGEAGLAEAVARRLALQTKQLAAATVVQGIQRIAEARELWQRRLAVATHTVERAQVGEWVAEMVRAQAELTRHQRLEMSRLSELNAERRRLESKPSGVQSLPAIAKWEDMSADEAAAQMRLRERALSTLEAAARLQNRTLAELQDSYQLVSLRARIQDVATKVASAWTYEIFAVDDRPITVGRFTVGMVILVVGLLFSGYLSRMFGQRLLPRLGIDAGASAAFESLLYYFFVVALVLLALRTVNVPLTAFTLLGGAAAIGIGFGSQNVVNNFISGLILLAERPIRVGDMIEIDGTVGTVEGIGARSTRVHSFTGIHIIVPNSAFLEKNVVNWTLSDDRVRTFVAVGVSYGSPVDTVFQLLSRAVDERPNVLRRPDPIVLFGDFGNDALLFEVHFWIRMRNLMDRRRVESDVRRAIETLFREAGIVVAFPQRDVHLDTMKPLDVRILPQPEQNPGSDQS